MVFSSALNYPIRMPKSSANPKVDWYFTKAEQWQKEFKTLRTIVLDCGLTEELKWGQPCYTLDDRNIVLIHGFKEYCALLFMKGALMKDPKHILIQQTENVQVGRQIRFANLTEIAKMESVLKTYVKEAIAVEKSGAKVPMKKTADFKKPKELQQILGENPTFRDAFERLTPGRQRGYILYFAAPKQSKTRTERIEKNMDKILDGIGLNDEYTK